VASAPLYRRAATWREEEGLHTACTATLALPATPPGGGGISACLHCLLEHQEAPGRALLKEGEGEVWEAEEGGGQGAASQEVQEGLSWVGRRSSSYQPGRQAYLVLQEERPGNSLQA